MTFKFLHIVRYIVILILTVTLFACASENQAINLSEIPDNSTSAGDGGVYTPNTSGSNDTCSKDEDDNCIDESDNTEPVQLALTSIEFGLNEIEGIECEAVTIPSGASFAAEIDKNNTSSVEGEEDTSYQFVFMTSGGSYTDERIEGSGELTICYLREEIGTHSGQIKLVLNANETTSSAYAYVIPVSGETLDKVFTITSPLTNQIIDSRADHNEGEDNAEGDYLITASGSVNTSLTSIYLNGLTTPVIIDADAVKYKADLNESGNFSEQIGVPQTPGLYDVKFSIETNKGSSIEKSVPIVVADTPDVEIEIRDSAGTLIDTASPTDAPSLIVGIKINNLTYAGSSQTEMPVTVYDLQFNGQSLSPDKILWYDAEASWCYDAEADKDYVGFEGALTYCVALSDITELQSGLNTITVKAKNDLGEDTDSAELILDNGKPTITITSPEDNALLDPSIRKITIKGKVKNYAPVDSSLVSSIPAVKNEDVGSYCQPDGEDDTDCPASNVKLWFNISTSEDNQPLYIYPQIVIPDGLTEEEYNSSIYNDPSTRGNCKYIDVIVDETTGETAKELSCNSPEGEFEITLDFNSGLHHGDINLYANIFQVQADSISGHNTIKIMTFQAGFTKTHTYRYSPDSGSGTLTAGTLGVVEATCSSDEDSCVERAPVMLNLSSSILDRSTTEGKKVITAVEYVLNRDLRFYEVINGWPHDTRKNGNVDLIKDYRDQYEDATGESFEWVTDIEPEWQKQFIWQGIHSPSMAKKAFALQSYKAYRMFENDPNVPECELHNSEMCFMESQGNQFDVESGFAVAVDACGNAITTAFVPISDLRWIAEADTGVTNTLIYEREWPLIAGPDLDFNDFVEGKWHVDNIEFKDGGWINADVCLIPEDIDVESCDDDTSHAKTPALWGHFISYNLIKGGLLQGEGIDDETMPLIWSLGKLRLKLNNIIRLRPETLSNGTWANLIDIELSPDIPEAVYIDVYDLEKNAEANSIILEPFGNCDGYYRELYNQKRDEYAELGYDLEAYDRDEHLPYGCNPSYNNGHANYPFLIDRTSSQGNTLYELHHDNGDDNFLLATVWQGVTDTIKKIVGCMDTELVNPLMNPDYFSYPGWVAEADRVSTEFEWEEFNLSALIGTSDLILSATGATARIPLEIGVDGVARLQTNQSSMSKIAGNKEIGTRSNSTVEQANLNGHLVRTFSADDLEKYPFTSTTPNTSAFAGLSINIEEIFNAASYLLFKKGPLSLLETFDVDDLEVNNNWSVGVDKVVLGRMDICDIAGLLSADLAYDVLFAGVSYIFNNPTLHLDIILDKNYPPTLSMNPIEYTSTETEDGSEEFDETQASEIQLSLTNVQVAVKELIPYPEVANVYYNPKDQEEVIRVRVDGVLTLKAIYHKELRAMNVFINDYTTQNLHLSVPPGHRGPTYNDKNVVNDLISSVLQNVFSSISSSFDPSPDATPTMQIIFNGEGSALSVVGLQDMEIISNTTLADNATCGDNVPLYYEEYQSGSTATESSKPDFSVDPTKIVDTSRFDSNAKTAKSVSMDNIAITDKEALTLSSCDLIMPKYEALIGEDSENPIREALCDFGIKDILLTPEIVFDNARGYIHTSSDIEVQLEEWLTGD